MYKGISRLHIFKLYIDRKIELPVKHRKETSHVVAKEHLSLKGNKQFKWVPQPSNFSFQLEP